jgi:hypothetical protein
MKMIGRGKYGWSDKSRVSAYVLMKSMIAGRISLQRQSKLLVRSLLRSSLPLHHLESKSMWFLNKVVELQRRTRRFRQLQAMRKQHMLGLWANHE